VETTSSLDLGYDMAPFLFTFGGVCYYFVIPEHCHLLIFLYYIPCNDIIISQSAKGIHFTSCQNMYKVN